MLFKGLICVFVRYHAFGSHVEDIEQCLYLAMVLTDYGSGVLAFYSSGTNRPFFYRPK